MPVRFAHYNLRAPQPLLEKLRTFYIEVVGLREGPRPAFAVFGYWLYDGAEPVVHLAERGAKDAPLVDGDTTFAHAAFFCTDQPAYELRLTQAGLSFRKRLVPETGENQIFLKDPAGNGVELLFRDE